MSSKRVDERNEKIIRGLMKLPPNRRCINCNNLGPQYVCTNFWTFVCTACSGIHREFTHRVKSVSMAKFTSQEVEALQKGGNQRARETYLVHWEPQRQRQPNSSNVEKVREFIKHVYVDKKYIAGIASDKPPRETLSLRNPEEETRRASSYHSYSQSPPYDYQYEERRYGKQLPALTRKPGSDRGLYEGKVSTFSSPSRFSDQAFEQPRASDFSVYSPSQSPNFQRDGRVKSPPYQATDNIVKENTEGLRRTQRATSSGSFGSFDSNSMSFKSNNSATSPDLVSAPGQSSEILQDKQFANSSLPQSSTSGNFGGLDLFDSPFAPQNVTSSPAVDQFQLPKAQPKAPIDLFEPPSTSSVPNVLAQKPSETAPTSLNNFSQMPPQPLPVVPKNEGWAMFDFPQHTPFDPDFVHSTPLAAFPNKGYIEKVDDALPVMSSGHQWPVLEGNNAFEPAPIHKPIHNAAAVHSAPPSGLPSGAYIAKFDAFTMPSTGQQWPVFEGSNAHEPAAIHTPIHNTGVVHSGPPGGLPNGDYIEKVDAFPVPSTGQQWPVFEDSNTHEPSSIHNVVHEPTFAHNLWHGEPYQSQVPFTNNKQSWDAFEDPTRQPPHIAAHQSGQEVAAHASFTTVDQHPGATNQTGFGRAALGSRPPITNVPLHVEAHPHVIERKSSNPFDLSDDCDFESSNMFLNMNSLQAALPSGHLQSSFVDDVTQSWFTHNPASHYVPSAQQGTLGYMGGPGASTQMPNVVTQEPVASVGGNPFA